MKWKRYVIPIYDVEILFFLTKDTAAVEKKINSFGLRLKKKHAKELHDDNGGVALPLYDKKNRVGFMFWMPSFTSSLEDHNTLTHEAVHVAKYVLKYIGFQKGIPTKYDEFEAYLTGNIAEAFLKFVRKK